MTMANLGFIGLGIMGKPMAGHLIAAGHTVHVYDLNPAPVRELASRGAVACTSSKQVAQYS
ncbi:MAG: NAD(P)-binding domain-containing protein, partial [Chloroflexota bacterium]